MNKLPREPHARTASAFTLIELLTVIAIIGILAAIIVPTVGKVRTVAKRSECVSQLRQWGMAVGLFANENKGCVAVHLKSQEDGTDGKKYPPLYQPYFQMKKGLVESGGVTWTIDAWEFMARCPSAKTPTGSIIARSYNFGRPDNGALKTKTADGGMFRHAPGISVRYYRVSEAAAPGRLILMTEVITNGQTVANGAQLMQHSRPVQTDTAASPGYVRHGGSLTTLFLDGHVETLSPAETDYGNADRIPVIDQWFTL